MHARTHRRTFGRSAAVGLIAAGAMVLAGCGDDAGQDDPDQTGVVENGDGTTDDDALDDGATDDGATEDGATEDGATDDEALGDPESYVGEEVTVSGDVGQLVAPTAFTLSGSGGELLVVGADDAVVAAAEGDQVRVTGTVEEDFDPAVLRPGESLDVYQDWVGEHYILASEVETTG